MELIMEYQQLRWKTCSFDCSVQAGECKHIYFAFMRLLTGFHLLFYFAAGAVCGYIRLKNKEDIEFVTKENRLIKEKFFLYAGNVSGDPSG